MDLQENAQLDTIEIKKSTLIIGIIIIAILLMGFYLSKTFISNGSKFVVERSLLISLDDDEIMGDENVDISVVEFSDFHCPFCGKFSKESIEPLIMDYVRTGKIKFVHRDFPIQNLHPNSKKYAEATECASEQGKFWELYNEFYRVNYEYYSLPPGQRAADPFSIEKINEYAQNIGIDIDELNSCMKSGKYESEVENDMKEGEFYGVRGTPTTFIMVEKKLPRDKMNSLVDIASEVDKEYGPLIKIYDGKNVVTISISGALPYNVLSSIIDAML